MRTQISKQPRITSGLRKSIVIKNKLFGTFIKSANSIIKEKLHNDYIQKLWQYDLNSTKAKQKKLQ